MQQFPVRQRVDRVLRTMGRLPKGRPHIPVGQRVHRILRKMERFSADRPLPDGFDACFEGEKIFGVYEAPGPHPPLVVTERGIGVLGEAGWWVVPYELMRAVDVPQDKGKLEADRLLILTQGGATVTLPMAPEGGFNDAYEWLRFLMRVLDDRPWEFDDRKARR